MQLHQKIALSGFDPIAPEQFFDLTKGGFAMLEVVKGGAQFLQVSAFRFGRFCRVDSSIRGVHKALKSDA